jgi:hypothetical protein
MFPEGIPTSTSVQNILLYQHHTMRMMYKRIAEALHGAGVTDRHPTDYLQFYCLGNREPPDEVSRGVLAVLSVIAWFYVDSIQFNPSQRQGGLPYSAALEIREPSHEVGRGFPFGSSTA